MTMNKIDLWRKGDRLTATKLNDALTAVNELIEAENKRLDKAAATSQGAQFNTISRSEAVPSWYQEITPLWNQDGETVLYDTWDGLGDLTQRSGLYGREVGLNALTATDYTNACSLCLLKDGGEIAANQQVVQEITINSSGSVIDNQVKILDDVNSIPQTVINPHGESKLYRRLSRIIIDPSVNTTGYGGSGDSAACHAIAQKFKSIATNDFTLSPITVSAVPTDSDFIPLVKQQGVFSKIKGIQNKGGLIFHTGNDDVIGIEALGGDARKYGAGCGISIECVNTNCYKISRNLYIEPLNSDEGGGGENAIMILCCKDPSDQNKITYKFYAATTPAQTYEFDPVYFCVKENEVTLNQTALYEIAQEVIDEIEVEVTACGIVDTVKDGKIKTATQGLSWDGSQYNAATVVSLVNC